MADQVFPPPAERIQALLDQFNRPNANAAVLLCDRHPPEATAYRVLAPDLSARELNYGQLRFESERLAAGFAALGVGPGDRVATLMGKSLDYLITVMAIWRCGAVHVPLFTAFAPSAIALRLSASSAHLIVCDATQRKKVPSVDTRDGDSLRIVTIGAAQNAGDISFEDLKRVAHHNIPMAACGGNAPIIEIYTSGTTGTPKGVVVPLRALASFQAYGEYGLDLRPDDRFWNAADPGWAYGLYFGIVTSLIAGVESFLFEGAFSAEATLEILHRYKITNFAAAPTVYRALRKSSPERTKEMAIRCASSAGEPLTPEVNDWAKSVLGVEVYDHYGQTETGMLINNHHQRDVRRPLKVGSMGQAMPGWTAVVLRPELDELASTGELGRIAFDLNASPLAWFHGYLHEPGKTAEKFSAGGRYYVTGDIGRVDGDGYFYFVSRDDDVIIMAGYRIGPLEVEAVILAHPAVSECAVVAVPDEIRGEVLAAAIVLAPGFQPSQSLSEEIKQKVKNEFAAHAYPREVHFVDMLPKTPSGKVRRVAVRQNLYARPNRS